MRSFVLSFTCLLHVCHCRKVHANCRQDLQARRLAAFLLAFNPIGVGPCPVTASLDFSLSQKVAGHRVRSMAPRRTSPSMLSPSGIDGWPEVGQAVVFFGYLAGLGVGTLWMTNFFDAARKALPGLMGSAGGTAAYRRFIEILPLLGVLYLGAGISHFTAAEGFRAIYPPLGTWGLWYLPGSAEFHVAWTGVAECLGGGGLLLGSLLTLLEVEQEGFLGLPLGGLLTTASAFCLFLLTVAVTPSNVYMYTHGAVMAADTTLDISFHYGRFGFQVLLLSLLLTLARDSFFYAWGEQLD